MRVNMPVPWIRRLPRQKIFKIDDHMAIGISGLTADARVLADYMRNERPFLDERIFPAIRVGWGEGILIQEFQVRSYMGVSKNRGKTPKMDGL